MNQHEAEAVELLERLGAVLQGHFIGTSDKHLGAYVSKEVPTRYPRELRKLADWIASAVCHHPVDIVVSPPMGALNLGSYVAERLDVEYAFLEEVVPGNADAGLAVKRTTFLDGVRGKRVGIVEDIITSGKTSRNSVKAVENARGIIEWVTCIWNRSGVTVRDLEVPRLLPLVNRQLEDYADQADCEARGLCSRGVPINLSPGHGKRYQTEYPHYPGGYV